MAIVLAVFEADLTGMILGGLPFLQLDRTGVALLGIALIGTDALTLQEAAEAIHLPTVILLFCLHGAVGTDAARGFYDWVTLRLAKLPLTPPLLLGALILASAALSAVFSNDIVCLAVASVLIDACRARSLDPVPFLLALACAANIGSAATLIGNPQNMLIGQTLQLSFAGYLREAALPVAAGLIATWALIVAQTRGRLASLDEPVAADEPRQEGAPLDRWQTAKGLTAALVIVVCFLFAPWPREVLALSNIVSNVPAVMPLPSAAHSLAGPTLALVNTLAGNLFIANIIVVDAAARAWAFR